MPNPTLTNADLEAAFLQAYDSFADAIFRHCCFRVYDRERARDLTQECFLRAWEYVASGKRVGNLRAFLYRVATNLIIDESRRKRPGSLDDLLEQGVEPAPQAATAPTAAEASRALAALDGLGPKFREILKLRYLDGLGPKEIAASLGTSENVVSVRLHRGLAQLRKMMS